MHVDSEMIVDITEDSALTHEWISNRNFRRNVKHKYGAHSRVESFASQFYKFDSAGSYRALKTRKSLLREFQLMEFDFEIIVIDAKGQFLLNLAYRKKKPPFIIYSVEDFKLLIEYSIIL